MNCARAARSDTTTMSAPRVVLLSDDLMFGSKVERMIRDAGAQPVLAAGPDAVRDAGDTTALLVVDLVTDAFDGIAAIGDAGVKTLAYYAHTDDDVRRAALEAGCDRVVPRSRMMREGSLLIGEMLAAG